MAPIHSSPGILPIPTCSPLLSLLLFTMTSTKCAAPWVSVKLGRALNCISLDVPSCPAVDAVGHEKAHAFDTTALAISAHLEKFDFAELTTCLTSHIPGSHVYSINQADSISPTLDSAPFLVGNIKPICFLQNDHTPVDLTVATEPAHLRPANLCWLRVSFTVSPNDIAPPGTNMDHLEAFQGQYDIPLPQTPVYSHMPRLNLWPGNTP